MKNLKEFTKQELVNIYNENISKYKLGGKFKRATIKTWNTKPLAIRKLEELLKEIQVIEDVQNESIQGVKKGRPSEGISKSEMIRSYFSLNADIKITLPALAKMIKSDEKNTLTLVRILSNPRRTKRFIRGVNYDRKSRTFTKKYKPGN